MLSARREESAETRDPPAEELPCWAVRSPAVIGAVATNAHVGPNSSVNLTGVAGRSWVGAVGRQHAIPHFELHDVPQQQHARWGDEARASGPQTNPPEKQLAEPETATHSTRLATIPRCGKDAEFVMAALYCSIRQLDVMV